MEDNPARVLFAALILGGRTLLSLKDGIKELPDKQKLAISVKFQELLQHWLNYDQNYSKWLSENLHRLNNTSVSFVEKLKEKASLHVSFSTVIDVNISDGNQSVRYDLYLKVLASCPKEKMSIV